MNEENANTNPIALDSEANAIPTKQCLI